jgi:Flp pilus assembly protein TadG
MKLMRKMQTWIKRWRSEEDGMAAIEAAFVFPILLVMLLGTYDMGNAILSNQKVIRASQVTGDLVTRERTLDQTELEEAIRAGELALEPQDASSYGVDIVSIRFDDDANATIVWRETRNMAPNGDVLTKVAALAEPNNGVVVVTVRYTFEPLFAGFVIGDIPLEEVAFTRGRKSAVVNRV